MTFEAMQALELRIAMIIVDDLIEAGYTVGVNDGEEITVKQSVDKARIREALRTTDEDYLLAYRDARQVGWVRLVYGNSGFDVVNDYTVNLEAQMTRANALADREGSK